MLDLFSGLHGASHAFRHHPEWEVISIDNNPALEATHHWDISMSKMQILELGWFDLIWASPPCVEFALHRLPFQPTPGKAPSMNLVKSAREIMDLMKPTHSIIENTKSGAHFISPLLGPPRQIMEPIYLWGEFPRFSVRRQHFKKDHDVWSTNPMRSNIRAKIPDEISAALLDAIMNQTILEIEYE